MRRIYFDHNATTPLDPRVFEAMKPYWLEDYGNASSIHWHGQRARAAVEQAREQVAGRLNAQAGEIVFTSGGTESCNMAVLGVVQAARQRLGGEPLHVVTTAIEHHAVLHAAQALERRGVRVTYVAPEANGIVAAAGIERAITPETVLISVMFANNELGTLQPVEAIASLAQERGIPFHTDAVQAAGKLALDLRELPADLVSISAHKLYGPQGAGALYVRKGTQLAPLMYGGHHERDRRPGTENVAGIVGFGKAAALAGETLAEESRRLAALRDRLERGLLERVPQCAVNGDRERRVPNTLNMRFDCVEGEGFVIACDLRGLSCSTGAACSSGSLEPSHVLAAIGLDRQQARAAVRFSLGRTTTAEEVDRALEIVPAVVEQLRAVSPHYAAAGADRN